MTKCLQWLPEKTRLCLILGATRFFEGAEKERHQKLNDAIKEFATTHPRIKYIEIDNCASDASDFEGGINHFSSRVYYRIAQEIIRVVKDATGDSLSSYSSRIIAWDNMIQVVRSRIRHIAKKDSATYKILKQAYNKVYKNRSK